MSDDAAEKKTPTSIRVGEAGTLRVEISTEPPTAEERAALRRFLSWCGAAAVNRVARKKTGID